MKTTSKTKLRKVLRECAPLMAEIFEKTRYLRIWENIFEEFCVEHSPSRETSYGNSLPIAMRRALRKVNLEKIGKR